MCVFFAYAWVQASQLGGATPTYDVYDSDNSPLVSTSPRTCLFLVPAAVCLSVYVSLCLSVELSIGLSVCLGSCVVVEVCDL